ncbi:anthranilate phosphoribosyltransferase [Rhodohalobacter mucosus]|uniref:Anthranilate phosphoribosyltransferase n=1 Tax=Rhodohalobacter mucosus TaxID=2079485 RepID=A0A316TUV0_9BACT|nr:anthranilate phosphoribosyltransferase [Rhodohalobacter mucosus]PWN07648.1 anthranilate phosphoribosyltransferase [Rhodohalobacter mucosus]
MSHTFTEYLEIISLGENLTEEQAMDAMKQILEGRVSGEEVAAFLMGMRAKGETVTELTGFVRQMREEAVNVDVDTGGAVDLCGTGGDKSGTFNISTAAMFVVAGTGVPVLKHGNRSVSSKSGSFDVLEELGAAANLQKDQTEALFNETGMAFMFAPNFHPALKYVMPARKALKLRTFFNMLGPLLNPADVRNQVIGAFSKDAAAHMIQILGNLQTESAFTLSSHDGLDEVSLTSQSEIFELKSHLSRGATTFDPRSLGYELVEPEELLGGDAKVNAEIIRSILNGSSTEAQRNIVEMNAAFAVHVSGAAGTLEEAKARAEKSLDSGEAEKKLNLFVKESKKVENLVNKQ